MAKKKTSPRKGMKATYQDRHTTPRVAFHLPQALLEVIDREAKDADRSRTAEILRALKAYYRSIGVHVETDPD